MDANRKKILFITQIAVLVALEAIIAFTPLGSIPIGPIVATLGMLPVTIAAVVLGTRASVVMGFVFGLFSLIVFTFMPPNPFTAFVFSPFYSAGPFQGNFWSLVICFVPRMVLGLVSGLVYKGLLKLGFDKTQGKNIAAGALTGIIGSLVHTLLVVGGIVLFFGDQYAEALGGILLTIIGALILTNGIPEAIVAGIVTPLVGIPVQKLNRSMGVTNR